MAWVVLVAMVLGGLPASAAPWGKKKEEEKQSELMASRIPYQPSGGWEAYFRDGNGDEYGLRLPVERNEEIDWMFLRFTPWRGAKPVVAVMAVENAVGHNSGGLFGEQWGDDDEDDLVYVDMGPVEELVTSSVFASDRFEVVEREEVAKVLAEQDFGKTDRVTLESAAKLGRLLGADYMLFAAVNEWTTNRNVLTAVVKSKSTAEVAMSFKLVDSDSAKLAFAGTYRAQTGDWAVQVPFFGMSESSPINYALTACINKAVYHLATSLPNRPWRGRVAALDGDVVVMNGGENRGVEVGQVYSVMTLGEDVVDPTTGEVLGQESKVIGSVQVTSVEERFAKAMVLEGCKGIKVSDLLEAQPAGAAGAGQD